MKSKISFIINFLKTSLSKEKEKLLPNGNYFFYTRNGFGIKTSSENKAKKIMKTINKINAKKDKKHE